MTQIVPTTEAERIERMEQGRNLALTHRQIDVACKMWRDPQNWRLVPAGVGNRNIYVRNVKSHGRT